MSRNVSAARAHSAIKSHIPTMHQPTLWWRKISIIRVSSCWRWRGDWGSGRRWGGLRLDSLPVFSTATHSKSTATPPHIPPPSPQPPLRQTIIIFPPISVPLHVSTAANIIREVSASAPHSGKSNMPRFPSAELRCSFKQGQQGKKHWVKDDDVHAGKKGKKAPQCGWWRVEGGLPWERRPTCVGCKRGDTRNGTTHSKTRTQQKTQEGWGGGNTEQHSDPPSWLQGQNFTPSVSPRRTRMYRKVTDTYLMPYSSEDYTRGWRKGQAVPGQGHAGPAGSTAALPRESRDTCSDSRTEAQHRCDEGLENKGSLLQSQDLKWRMLHWSHVLWCTASVSSSYLFNSSLSVCGFLCATTPQ